MLTSFKSLLKMKRTSIVNAIHALLLTMLPYLQIWCIIQIEKTSGKGDVMNILLFMSKVMLPNEQAVYILCDILGLKISTDNNGMKVIELKSSVSLSSNVLKALSVSPQWSHHSTIDIDKSDWGNTNNTTIITSANMVVNHLKVTDDVNDWIMDEGLGGVTAQTTNNINDTTNEKSTTTDDNVHIEIVNTITDDIVEAFERLIPQLSQSNPPPSRERLVGIAQSSSTTLIVARANNVIIGTLTLVLFYIPTGLRGIIEDVVVDISARGQGVGEALTRYAISHAKAQGVTSIDLTSRPSRDVANRLYQKIGFVKRDTNVYRYNR